MKRFTIGDAVIGLWALGVVVWGWPVAIGGAVVMAVLWAIGRREARRG